MSTWTRIEKTLVKLEHFDFVTTWGIRIGSGLLSLGIGKFFQWLFGMLVIRLAGEVKVAVWLIFSGLVFWGVTALVGWRRIKGKLELDGELQRIFTYPRAGVAYGIVKEIWQAQHKKNPKLDHDIIAAMYIVNASPKTHFVRDVTASVEVSGQRKTLERLSDFFVNMNGIDFEYGLERANDQEEPDQLKPLLPNLPLELGPRKPTDGWVRYLLTDSDPEEINNDSWRFTIIDSLGKEHPVMKVAAVPRAGELGLRRVKP